MQVIQIYMHNALRNFNYIIYSEKSKEAIFIDPLDLSQTLPIAKLKGLVPKYLVNTHYHPDHMYGNDDFLSLEGTEEIRFKDGDKLELADGDYIQALYTPGHVMNHICFMIFSDNKAIGLITGDALFNAGVGHCKLGGDVATHFASTTNIIKTLPEELLVYPSHDYLLGNLNFSLEVEPSNSTTQELIKKRKTQDLDHEFIQTDLKLEKQINPFLRLDSHEIKKSLSLGEDASSQEVFIKLRQLRDNW